MAARTPLGDVFLVEHTMSTRMVGRAADLVASCFGRGEKAIVLFLDEIEAGVRHVLEP